MKNSIFKPMLVIPAALFFLQACSSKPKEYGKAELTFGTVCYVKIYTEKNGAEARNILDGLFSELNRLELIFSTNMQDSVLEKIHINAGKSAVDVPDELYGVLEKALFFAEKTGGAFNPAIGPLVKLWNIGTEDACLPPAEDLKEALNIVDYKNIELKDGTVFLRKKGMRLDLGGIAKGFAADYTKSFLLTCGIKKAVIDFGGNVLVMDTKPDGSLWKVGLKNPVIGEPKSAAAYIDVSGKTVVTSGNYERFFEKEGVIYHHILSAQTGYPVKNNLRAVTVIGENSMEADALSTSFFVMGLEKSLQLIKDFPEVSAVFFLEDNSIFTAGAEVKNLNILDDKFRLERF